MFQGEDEIMFIEYRKQLKVLLDNCALLVIFWLCTEIS